MCRIPAHSHSISPLMHTIYKNQTANEMIEATHGENHAWAGIWQDGLVQPLQQKYRGEFQKSEKADHIGNRCENRTGSERRIDMDAL